MIGKVVSERYKIEKYLGGGMSSVYQAKDIILDRDVVVKMIKSDPLDKEKSVRRFQREVESTIQLSHPNIVSVIDVDDTEEYHILVTEVVHGPNLKAYIMKNNPLDIDEIVSIAMMTLKGIEHAHDRGIIHRDIKPQNLLLDEKGRIKITDFGIAKALSETRMTETNQVIGSVQYISPEQAKGQNTDERTDIYSFGIMLFELLTGRLPYEAETAVSVALKHISDPFPDINDYREIPIGLKNIVMKCTEKDPRDRYRHANDVLSALVHYKDMTEPYQPVKKITQDKTVVTPPVVPVKKEEKTAPKQQMANSQVVNEPKEEKLKKKRRKWPWIALLIFLLLASSASAAFFLWDRIPPTVEIENLQNMTVEEAESYLESESLVLGEIEETYDDNFEEGTIIETTPVSGSEVERESEIDFLVSLGKQPFTVEDYTGANFEETKAALEEAGFSNVVAEYEYSDQEVGTVLSQSIEQDEEVYPEEETMTLTVSEGHEPIPITNYTGTDFDTAKSELEAQGFIVNVTTEVYSDSVAEGAIVSQDPSYGDFLPGSQINVIVSLGEAPPEETTYQISLNLPYPESSISGSESSDSKSESESDSEEEESEPVDAKIYIDDKDNGIGEVAETIEITEDTNHTISLVLEEGQDGSYKVEVDGEEVINETVEN
ncbi:Stk1 family PASTA domain-containing Ser/Thr kinase [Jeotgalicoccus huakuii]|nr:Stk1 family PASTA domain-containing Ser/Thr kinase [Jeotgalicoccus huakuii]